MNLPTSTPWDNYPPGKLTLKRGDLHLWRIHLDLSPEKIALLKKTLSSDEIIRADRLIAPVKRENFIASRGSLRVILGRYLDLKPGEIQFEYGEEGKPFIKKIPLSFNLSHSADWAALAVTNGSEVGIDIEYIDPRLDYEKVAAQFFSLQERDRLMQFSPRRRRRGFYRIWTAKEGTLKCSGSGFTRQGGDLPRENLHSLDFSTNNFELNAFHLAKNYVATLVAAGDISSVKRWHLKG
ncbi:MAG: 4'-phosphopantetheinyl transferase superfamily protein [bacterium]|nr:4'-phosphopantetheinyl transferase superfamily protein [bacterium]